jgi:TonB family protein
VTPVTQLRVSYEVGGHQPELHSLMLRPVLLALAVAGCDKSDHLAQLPRGKSAGPRPDEMPALLNSDLPFRYPAALYARKVQGNVTLELFIDQDGRVVADSTRVDEPSGFPELDSAAVTGSPELRFVPAKLRGEAIPVSILFPVYFRHPEARPLPGDSVLQSAARDSAAG